MRLFLAGPLALVTAAWLVPSRAEACGCFAPPTPAEPVVQAGERILFAVKDGVVTAHIQIQYVGSAAEFAWLVPLPSVPKLKIGTDDVFNELEKATAPSFVLDRSGTFCGGGGGFGCGSADSALARISDPDPMSPAVIVSSVGPYDYAVVKADSKQPMLDWLNDNRFFVPTGTEAAIDPYIHEGAYFLALRLRSGQAAGDLVPIVLEYESDLPMVPIILTSVASAPNLGILVWVLGEHRAVPRNYQHVLINHEKLNWAGGASNYAEVVAQAIDEADEHHAFITEYAGSSEPMVGILDAEGRFPRRSQIEGIARAYNYFVELYRYEAINWRQLQAIVQRHYGNPSGLPTAPDREAFFEQLYRYSETEEAVLQYDPLTLTEEIWERIVTPTVEAGQLFRDLPKLTRLYTVLSPEEMTEDPVFAFNADLPDVPRQHAAYLSRDCEDDEAPTYLSLEDGRVVESNASGVSPDGTELPAAAEVQVLGLEGPPQVVRRVAPPTADAGGCSSNSARNRGVADLVLIFASVFSVRAWNRRRRS